MPIIEKKKQNKNQQKNVFSSVRTETVKTSEKVYIAGGERNQNTTRFPSESLHKRLQTRLTFRKLVFYPQT